MKFGKNVTLDMESIVIVDRKMQEKQQNFSQSVNYLIHSADYLLKKIELLREKDLYEKTKETK